MYGLLAILGLFFVAKSRSIPSEPGAQPAPAPPPPPPSNQAAAGAGGPKGGGVMQAFKTGAKVGEATLNFFDPNASGAAKATAALGGGGAGAVAALAGFGPAVPVAVVALWAALLVTGLTSEEHGEAQEELDAVARIEDEAAKSGAARGTPEYQQAYEAAAQKEDAREIATWQKAQGKKDTAWLLTWGRITGQRGDASGYPAGSWLYDTWGSYDFPNAQMIQPGVDASGQNPAAAKYSLGPGTVHRRGTLLFLPNQPKAPIFIPPMDPALARYYQAQREHGREVNVATGAAATSGPYIGLTPKQAQAMTPSFAGNGAALSVVGGDRMDKRSIGSNLRTELGGSLASAHKTLATLEAAIPAGNGVSLSDVNGGSTAATGGATATSSAPTDTTITTTQTPGVAPPRNVDIAMSRSQFGTLPSR